jgi:hypothetical protein
MDKGLAKLSDQSVYSAYGSTMMIEIKDLGINGDLAISIRGLCVKLKNPIAKSFLTLTAIELMDTLLKLSV